LSKRKGANRAGSRAPLSASSASASETADDDASEDAGASVLDAAVDTTVNPGDSVSSSSAGEATSQPGTSSYAIATAGSATGGHSSSSLARATYRDALQQSKGAAGPPVLGGKRPSNSGEMPKPPSKRGSGSEFLETSTRNVSAAASGLLATGSLTHSRKLRAGVGLTALSTTGRQLPSSRGAAAPTVAGCRSSYRPPAAPRRPSREGSRATSPTEMLSRALGKAAFSAATAFTYVLENGRGPCACHAPSIPQLAPR